MVWTLACSCSGGSVRLHRAESDCGFGPHLFGSLSRIWPAQCHPCSPRGAADSLGFHQNWGNRRVKIRFSTGGLTASWRGWRQCHLERPKLHATLLFLLEAATLLPTRPAACTKNKAFTSDKPGCYLIVNLFSAHDCFQYMAANSLYSVFIMKNSHQLNSFIFTVLIFLYNILYFSVVHHR